MHSRTPSSSRRPAWCALPFLGLLLSAASAWAQVPGQPADGPSDPKELRGFLDEFFATRMKELHIPGAAVVVVKDGQVLCARGYGFADLGLRKPVIPEKTLFRVGSVSKVFTATAVMQLAERGKLALDDDVNRHLRLFQLDDAYSRPVTVANLLTHTGGFDTHFIGEATAAEADVTPLGPYLAKLRPRPVRPPGEVSAYSNTGYALAGHLVAEISGTPFAEYIDREILRPLDMRHSSFLLPAHLEPDLAVGYVYEQGAYRPLPHNYFNIGPAASLQATATDMAHFMIAHLQGGRWGDARILQEATAREMHRQQFANHLRLPGWAYGFHPVTRHDQHVIEHGGELRGFLCQLLLLPDRQVGLFVAMNRGVSPNLPDAFVDSFFDHYYPPSGPHPVLATLAQEGHPAERFVGSYRNTGFARHSLEKFCQLMGHMHSRTAPDIRVSAQSDGTISLGGPFRWREVEPLVFQRLDGKLLLAFREDGQGRVTHLLLEDGAYERLPWYETLEFQSVWATACVLVMLSACLTWPAVSVVRRIRKKSSPGGQRAGLARWLAGVVCALDLIFLIGLTTYLALLDPIELYWGVPGPVVGLLVIPLVTAPLTVVLAVVGVWVWKSRYWTLPGRLHYLLVTLAALAYIPLLMSWNLLGFCY